MKPYRILSLDGGGIRGYLTILLIERLASVRPAFLEQIDLFAGTSTGSIIALGLAAGKSPTEIRLLYEKQGARIFHDSLLDNIRDVGFALGAKYSNKNLQKALADYFGEMKLRELERKVLIASFDLDQCSDDDKCTPHLWKAKFFHNYPGEDCDGFESVVDVAMRSSAAPYYFPNYQGYVDGVVVANNPSTCAVTQVLKAKAEELENIVLLSLGTGLNPRYIDDPDTDWGWLKWTIQLHPKVRRWYGMPLVYMMWEASVDLANCQCEQLLQERFHRLDPLLPTLIDIDEVRRMPMLKRIAGETYLNDTLNWMDAHFVSAKSADVEINVMGV